MCLLRWCCQLSRHRRRKPRKKRRHVFNKETFCTKLSEQWTISIWITSNMYNLNKQCRLPRSSKWVKTTANLRRMDQLCQSCHPLPMSSKKCMLNQLNKCLKNRKLCLLKKCKKFWSNQCLKPNSRLIPRSKQQMNSFKQRNRGLPNLKTQKWKTNLL